MVTTNVETSTETDAESVSERDKCRLLTEVAMSKAAEKCGSDEAMKEQLRMMLGMTSAPDEEPDPNCEAAMKEGLTEETIRTPRGLNQWVFCRAWDLYKKKDDVDTLSEATETAWAEAHATAEEKGVEI